MLKWHRFVLLVLVCSHVAIRAMVGLATAQSLQLPTAAATAAGSAGATAGAAVCSLTLVGFGNRTGIKEATLSCTGGTIQVAAHRVLQDFWGTDKALLGVVWAGEENCVTNKECLLTICGRSNAVFPAATVTLLKSGSNLTSKAAWQLAVCVTTGSTITFRKSSFTMIKGATPLVIHSNSTSVLVEECTIHGNNFTPSFFSYSSAIRVDNAHLTILSSTVAMNNASSTNQGTVTGAAAAQINIQNSRFYSNMARYGGAIYAKDHAVITIKGSHFERNNASSGGAVYALNQAYVQVLPNGEGEGPMQSTFKWNRAVLCGGDVQAMGSAAVVRVSNAVLEGSTASEGGSLCTYGNASVFVANSRLTGASATGTHGGCALAEGNSSLTMYHTLLSGCSSDRCGGGVGVKWQARLHLINCTIRNTWANGGGALCVMLNGTAEVLNTTITGGHSTEASGACVSALNNALVRLVNTRVSHCRTPRGGGGIGVSNQAMLELVNSIVSNNRAGNRSTIDANTNAHGGGVALWGSASMLLDSSTLSGNYAHYAGGGLYLSDESTVHFKGDTNTLILNNTAGTTGGGIRLASGLARKTLSKFLMVAGNIASNRSSDISNSAVSIHVLRSNANELKASDSREGFLQLTLNVSGRNGMPSDDDLTYSLYDANNVKLFDQNIFVTQGTDLKEVAISIKRPPGKYYLVLKNAFVSLCGCARANVTVNIVKCPKGFVTGGRDDTCNRCPTGLFSLDPHDAQCSVCGANAVCPGGASVWPVKGFWNSAPQSVQMHRCFNADACLGAKALTAAAANQTAAHHLQSVAAQAAYKTAQCSAPYQGNLCGDCKQGFGRVRPFLCRRCMSQTGIIVLYVVGAVAMIGLVKLLVHFSASAENVSRADMQTPIAAELLRALVIHAQWLYIFSMMVGVPWPVTLAWPLQVVGGVWSSTSGSSIGFECILQDRSGLPVAAQKLLICMFTPVGILCGVLMIEALSHCLRPRRSRSRPTSAEHGFTSVMMCIVFMFLPTWVNTALSLFTCATLDTPVEAPYQAEAVGSWWVEDMSQLCYSRSGYHRGWALGLGVPLTLLLCVGLPAGVFLFMWFSRKQGKLQDMQFQEHYGFMYRLWKDEWCWWESVVLLQTCALVMVSTFGFALGPFYQGILSATVLATVGMLLLAVKPFKCPAAGRVAVISVCVLFFTAQVALTFIPYNSLSPPSAYGNTMGVVLMLANMSFLIGTTWMLARVVDWTSVRGALSVLLSSCCRGTANVPISRRRQLKA